MKSNKINVICGDWMSPGYFDIRTMEEDFKLYIEISYMEDGIIHDKNVVIENMDNKETYDVLEKYLKKILPKINVSNDIIIDIVKHIEINLYIDFPEILSYKIGEIGFNDVELNFLPN